MTAGTGGSPSDVAVDADTTRVRVRVAGIVQGVGFRPFVHRLATDLGLAGLVGNDRAGVFVEAEGDRPQLDRLIERIASEAPPMAVVEDVVVETIEPTGGVGFAIVESAPGAALRSTLVPPDVATCADCLADVHDPADRRYRYPFTNCTNCGPRFTIIRDLPYDRPSTTMAAFEMCPACAAEYVDPADRRYHAQPVACPGCGPSLRFERADSPGGATTGTDAVLAAVHDALAADRVVAIKGLGGYHLAVDATSDAAVARLRDRKGRVDKPFAVMAADLATAREVADLSDVDVAALTSPARPIVLARRLDDAALSAGVAPGNPLIGVMLPYTPLHHLLFEPVPNRSTVVPRVIVLTSGNLSNEPICFDDDDARRRLAGLADAFCTHDRPIEVPCDDSVVRVVDGMVVPVRRSRGYAPIPVTLPVDVPPLLAVGGELKNTSCVAAGRRAWVGQHVGDMENLETLAAFEAGADAFCRMYEVTPSVLAVDLHPGYLTRRWAVERGGAPVVEVQHHHAHVAAVMAEHGLDGAERVLGFAFDGTGYGVAADATTQIWGGEVLLADYVGFERAGHLAPLPLPGGDAGVRNPCRIAVAYLTALGLPTERGLPAVAACDAVELGVVRRQVERDVGCVPTTSMGRFFDAVASLLGVRHRITYEAQAAIELEALAERGRPGAARLGFAIGGDGVIDPRPVLEGLVDGVLGGVERADLALGFHIAVASSIVESATGVAARIGRRPTVVLTGGVFQNALLVQLVRRAFDGRGFTVLAHRVVPTNDGGLALGQAVVAGARTGAAAPGTTANRSTIDDAAPFGADDAQEDPTCASVYPG